MQTYNNPKQFIQELKNSRRVRFDNGSLMAEISVINGKTIHREWCIKYSEKIGEKWVSYSSCVSSFIRDILEDFSYECKQLNIN